jgi:hypothetical protein
VLHEVSLYKSELGKFVGTLWIKVLKADKLALQMNNDEVLQYDFIKDNVHHSVRHITLPELENCGTKTGKVMFIDVRFIFQQKNFSRRSRMRKELQFLLLHESSGTRGK